MSLEQIASLVDTKVRVGRPKRESGRLFHSAPDSFKKGVEVRVSIGDGSVGDLSVAQGDSAAFGESDRVAMKELAAAASTTARSTTYHFAPNSMALVFMIDQLPTEVLRTQHVIANRPSANVSLLQ